MDHRPPQVRPWLPRPPGSEQSAQTLGPQPQEPSAQAPITGSQVLQPQYLTQAASTCPSDHRLTLTYPLKS